MASDHRMTLIGLSDDRRTNKWRFYCGQRSWEPRTTMFAKEITNCKICGAELFIDYNAKTIAKATGAA